MIGTAEKASLRKQQFDGHKPVKTDIIPIHLTDSQYPPSLLALGTDGIKAMSRVSQVTNK